MMKIRYLAIVGASLGLALAAHAAQPQVTQREKMKSCNAEAKAGAKKGAERKAFMKTCLSSGASDKGAAAAKAAAPKSAKP
jgi:psiF repeat